jgi:HK97 gp10 family phage protein
MMAGTFRFEIKGFAQLEKRLKAVPAKIKKEVSGELQDGARRINAKQLRLAPVDEGGLKQGTIYKKVNELQVDLTSSKHYTPFTEFGTKRRVRIPPELQDYAKQFNLKGPNIGFDAFLKIITDWVRRKGIAGRFSVKSRRRVGSKANQQNEDAAAAYPIALSILRHGVKPHPFFFQPFFDEREGIIKNVEKALKDI